MIRQNPLLLFAIMIFLFSSMAYAPGLPDIEKTYTVKDAVINNNPAKEITFTRLSKEYLDTATELKKTLHYGDAQITLRQKNLKSGTKTSPYACNCRDEIVNVSENKTIETIKTCDTCYAVEHYNYYDYEFVDPTQHTLRNNVPVFEVFEGCTKLELLPSGKWGCLVWTDVAIRDVKISGATWWGISWAYRVPINITHSSAQTDYQIKINHNFSSEYSAGKINQTCKDIRFALLNGSLLPFWIEKCNFSASDNATLWVKTAANSTIYMYYGNSAAGSASDGANTFLIFDDFNRANSGTVGNGWSEDTQQGSGPGAEIYGNELRGYTTAADAGSVYRTQSEFSSTEILWEQTSGGGYVNGIGYGSSLDGTWPALETRWFSRLDGSTNDLIIYIDGSASSAGKSTTLGTWYSGRARIYPNWTTQTKIWLRSVSEPATWDITTTSVPSRVGTAFTLNFYKETSGGDGYGFYDNIRMKKYIFPEPTYTFGIEEIGTSAPTYSDNGHNTTIAGTTAKFFIQYNHTSALHPNGQYKFSTNNTGSWIDEAISNFTTTPEWINITKTLNHLGGIVIGYRWYASGNNTLENNTIIYTFTTVDLSAPTSNNPPDASHIINSSAGIGWILKDETGPGNYIIFRNSTIQNASSAWLNATNLNVSINTTTIGIWNYTISYNDSSGNAGIIDTVMVTITPPDSTNPNVTISTLSGTTTDTTPDITFTATDNIDANMTYELFFNGVGYGIGYVANDTATTITTNQSLTLGAYNIYINASDDSGNTGQSNTITLTISKALAIYVYDEITLSKIPATIEISNTSDTKYYAIGARYKSGIFDAYDAITGSPEYACDMDISTSVIYRFDAVESDEFYCYIPIPLTNNQQYNLSVALDADAKLYAYLYNSDTLAYDNIFTQTGAGAGHGTTYDLNFIVNNSDGKYQGEIKFFMSSLGASSYFTFIEVFPVNPTAIDLLYLDFDNMTSGTTTVRINAPEAWGVYSSRDYYFYFTATSTNTLNAYLLKNAQASSATYITLNSLESAIENVLITVNKYIAGAYVEVSQKKTDGSGTALLLLDPTNTYQFIFTHSEYDTLTKTLTPALSSYKVYLSQSTSINFTALYDDLYYIILPYSSILDNSTAQPFNFSIISTNSSLEYQGMNITYNNTMYFSNHVTGSPAGSTINATLDIHNWTGTFTLTAYFKKSGYDEQIINKTYRVYRTDPQGYTIYEAIQNANNDTAGFGMFTFGIIAIIITAISIAVIIPYSITGSAIVGLAVLGILSYINWFSWKIYFLVCITTLAIIYLQGDR